MKAQPESTARTQPVKLTDKVLDATESASTDNVEHERQQRLAMATVAVWNAFNANRGSFADEYQ